ncbi:hypothetical protein [Candidatus Nitronereus thalassa]|uniref:Uncharacterized protein n=1 Tax=Candidatus Nitronereus thalassa TaxID=3020898 RepID=A0ABU3KAV2_9BACT|nr:hypothetical protein [Candidatus Nitronereus thalassa]MDT7043610.1 hypothetical protein [Candidatus Nitronereus thalassa]
MTAHRLCLEPPAPINLVWGLVLLIPLLLASEKIQQATTLSHLPDQSAYRSDFSDQVFKSSKWRQPPPNPNAWRAPASPQIEWRTDAGPEPSRSMELRDVDLYPRQGAGGSSTFDLSTREDQSGFKVFEFDFGR